MRDIEVERHTVIHTHTQAYTSLSPTYTHTDVFKPRCKRGVREHAKKYVCAHTDMMHTQDVHTSNMAQLKITVY